VPFDDRLIAREYLEALQLRQRQRGRSQLDCLLV
jgi:hypothetical protein